MAKLLSKIQTKKRGDLAPDLSSLAYRFTLILPIANVDGDEAFSLDQVSEISWLFNHCFKGFLITTFEETPPYSGHWLPASKRKPVIDKHVLLIVYTPQNENAVEFFRKLKHILQRKEIAQQDIVVIEKISVELLSESAV